MFRGCLGLHILHYILTFFYCLKVGLLLKLGNRQQKLLLAICSGRQLLIARLATAWLTALHGSGGSNLRFGIRAGFNICIRRRRIRLSRCF